MAETEIKIDREKIHEEVDKITQTLYFQYIQAETRKLRERAQSYQLGFAAEKSGLSRRFSVFDVFVMTCCTLIGLAISARSITIQAAMPGIRDFVPLAFLVAGVPALLIALCYGILSSSIPRSGGDYVFISRGFHPFLAFWASWTKWFGIATALGFISYVTGSLLIEFLELINTPLEHTQLGDTTLTLAILTLCFAVNLAGARIFKWAIRVSFIVFVAGGFITTAVGFSQDHAYFLDAARSRLGAETVSFLLNTGETITSGHAFDLRVLLGAAAMLFYAYWGLETAIAASGEVKNPEMAIPKGIVAGVAFTVVYYVLYATSVYHVVPKEFAAGYVALHPDANVLQLYGLILPQDAVVFLSLSLVVAVLSDIFPLMLSASRILFAWAFDGMMPRTFARVGKNGIPTLGLTLTYIVSFLSVVECYYTGYLRVLDIATLGMLWTYILVAVTIIAASFEKPLILKNAKFSLGRFNIVVAVLAFLTCLVLFGEFIIDSSNSFLLFVAWSGVGVVVYYWVQRIRLKQRVDMQATFALIPPE